MKRNPWPYAIIAYFVLFISGIITWVTFAMRHDDQLVRADYYAHEIEYQAQIDRVVRTAPLRAEIDIAYNQANHTLTVKLPGTIKDGQIHLYRPSDARLDRKIPVSLDSRHSQTIDLSEMQDGFWKVFVSWTAGSKEYHFEKPLVLTSK